MNLHHLKNAAIAIALLFAVASCNKKDAVTPVNSAELAVKNGRTVFANETALRDFMAYAKEANFNNEYVAKLHDLEREGFHSLQQEGQDDPAYAKRAELRKFEEHDKLVKMYPNARALENPQGIDDEDELIADPFFASILNDKRELQVGDKVYKYTVEGVFVVDAQKVEKLYAFMKQQEVAQINAPNSRVYQDNQQVQQLTKDVILIKPVQNYESLKIVLDNGCQSCGDNQRVDPSAFKLCSTLKKNIWTKAFGPKVECTDNHDRRRRIKTKVWNQNYVLYSSIGISVRAQKRRARVWWANKVDELELGISQASFRYPKLSVQWPDPNVNFFYTTRNGIKVDQWGRSVGNPLGHPESIFDGFPIKDKDKEFFSLYTSLPVVKNLFKNGKLIGVKGKDINKQVKNLIVNSVKRYWRQAEKDLENKPAIVFELPGNTEKDLTITYVNWYRNKKNENAIRNIFDWNTAQIGFKKNLGDGKAVGFKNFKLKKTAKAYKELVLTGYGVGRRGGTWKGGQVVFEDQK